MKRTKSKEYEMVKSILPSRAAKSAKKAKDGLHRRNRRKSNIQCHEMKTVYIDALDDIEEDTTFWGEPHRSDGYDYDIVYDRRSADHLNHFIAWAWLKTAHLDQRDKMSWMRSHCPMGLLGYHAMSHLDRHLGYDPISEQRWGEDTYLPSRFDNSPPRKWHMPRSATEEQSEFVAEFVARAVVNRETRDLFNHIIRMDWMKGMANIPAYQYTHDANGNTVFLARREVQKNWIAKNPLIQFTPTSNQEDFIRQYFWKIYNHFHPDWDKKKG